MLAALGIGGATIPFLNYLLPSARTKALGANTEVDISDMAPGQETPRCPQPLICRL